MSTSLIYSENFQIRATECGEYKKMTFPALVMLFQEASLRNIVSLNAAAWEDKRGNYSWVLLRKEVTIQRYPDMGETVKVLTYPAGFDRILAFRDYIMYDINENVLATASSTWTYFDLDSRKISRIPPDIRHLDASDERDCLPRCAERISSIQMGENWTEITINRYHLDWNGHVNNGHFFKFFLAAIEGKSEPKNFVLHIKKEVRKTDRIRVNVARTEYGVISEMHNQNRDIVARAQVKF